MDFSAFNPLTSNSLNIAARNNNVLYLRRLLLKNNPNCVDNRGWTCLHEAAANDSYESLQLILNNPNCRPLAETFEGHTALYLACRENCSLKTIEALLKNVKDIANYASTEMVSPLHLACSKSRLELVQMLIDYGAILDVQDFDGDTPLHDAAFQMRSDVVSMLLHAGAEPNLKNETLYSPFHLACFKGSIETIIELQPFIYDFNELTCNNETPLILAAQSGKPEVVEYLLKNHADPHIRSKDDELALMVALTHGNAKAFKILLEATDREEIDENIILFACKPLFFNMDIIISLLESDLGPEFFNCTEEFHVILEDIGGIRPSYLTNAPLNSFLQLCEYIYNKSKELFDKMFYLFLMHGVSVNALYRDECPPIVYIHYCPHTNCFKDVLRILMEHDCDIEYNTCSMPDVFITSLGTCGSTIPLLMPYSLSCEPDSLLSFANDAKILDRIPIHVQNSIYSIIDINSKYLNAENFQYYVPTLKHLSRKSIRKTLREKEIITTREFLEILKQLPIPVILQSFLRYI